MAKEHSFDISAKIDMQEMKNALDQANREVVNRYDFKGILCEINYKEKEKVIELASISDNKVDALKDIVVSKINKRGLPLNSVEELKTESISGGNKKMLLRVVDSIETKEAKKICADIKDSKIKVKAQIQGDAIRVSGKNLDDLQKVMALLKQGEYDAPLVFDNYR